jgi:hypothetical protein
LRDTLPTPLPLPLFAAIIAAMLSAMRRRDIFAIISPLFFDIFIRCH